MITVDQSARIFQIVQRVSALKTVCSWCHVTIAEGGPGPISHGICPICAELLEAEQGGGR